MKKSNELKHNDLLIKVLEYGKENSNFKFDDILEHIHLDFDHPFSRWLYLQIGNSGIFKGSSEVIQILFTEYNHSKEKHPDIPLNLSVEDYFNLLEYQELKEARKSSRNAMIVAIIAIGISGALATGSILIQLGIIG